MDASFILRFDVLSIWFVLFLSTPPIFFVLFFFLNDPAPPEIYPFPLHAPFPFCLWYFAVPVPAVFVSRKPLGVLLFDAGTHGRVFVPGVFAGPQSNNPTA